MYLIAGLGNPGDKYLKTRHNIGFMIIDEMIKNHSVSSISNKNFQSLTYKVNSNIYSKPQTFMNNSGEAVLSIADYYNIENEKIIVIHDDLDLSFGTVKFKLGGSHGGHNGLRSIDKYIGDDYLRVRVGIGKPENKSSVSNYVLSNFSQEEFQTLDGIISHTIKAIEALQKLSLEEVKSKYTLKAK